MISSLHRPLTVAALLFLIDLGLKNRFIQEKIPPIDFGFLSFAPSINRGIAFSISFPLSIVIIATVLILVALAFWWQRMTPKERMSAAFPIGLLVGGAISNLVDRLSRGGVIDYINILTGSFNLADIAIITGILWLLLSRNRLAKNA